MMLSIAALIGLAVGTHIATWGMYKDSIHEPFTRGKYARSIAVGTVLGPLGVVLSGVDVTTPSGIVILFGLTYALERSVTEFWKTFVRDEDQSKYFIPMQLHVMGRVVRRRWVRLGVGMAVISAAVALLFLVRSLEPGPGESTGLARVAAIASIGGWFSAFGGAFKDAPIEGFETLKFFRSPLVAALYGMAVSGFSSSYPVIALTAIGFTVATLETYKTFFFPSVPRGKFAGKPVLYPDMLLRRRAFVPVYVLIWAGVLITFVAAFASGRRPDACPAGRETYRYPPLWPGT